MAAVVQRNCVDHAALFADQKKDVFFKLANNVSGWLQYAGLTQSNSLGAALGTVAGAFDVPATIVNLHTLGKTIQKGGQGTKIDPARQIVGDFTTFGESFCKAVKWTLGFFKDAVTAPWTAAANAFGMYNCVDHGLRQVVDLTSECKKSEADKNANKIAHHALDVAKFVAGFALNALSFAGIVAGIVIASPVMLILSSVALSCTVAAFFFKQEANNPRV